jgi:hypothetical protein
VPGRAGPGVPDPSKGEAAAYNTQITYMMVDLVRFQVGYPVCNPRPPMARSTDSEVCKFALNKSHTSTRLGISMGNFI